MRQPTLGSFGYGCGQSVKAHPNPLKSTKRKAVKEVIHGTQQFLDAGQKVIGAVRCKKCQMFYTPGTEDDVVHNRFCGKSHDVAISFIISKGHRIISEDESGTVVMIDSSDKAPDQKKVAQLKAALQHSASPNPWTFGQERAFLLVSQRKVLGFALAEQIEKGYLMDSSDGQSELSVPAVCGILCLWVSSTAPSPDVAYEQLISAAQKELIYGYRIPSEQVAFFSPSDEVRQWAARIYLHPLVYRRA